VDKWQNVYGEAVVYLTKAFTVLSETK